MFPTSFVLLALASLAPSFLSAPQVAALPTSTPQTLHLARGWSHSLRLSSSLASRAYDSSIPFKEADVITSNCIAQCIPVVALNSTCGTSYYKTDCDMCSTTGLDAYTVCASCWVQSLPVKQQGEAMKRAAGSLAKIEQSCQSYTRTALPSIPLSLTPLATLSTSSNANTTTLAVQSSGTSSVSSSSGASRRLGLGVGGRMGVAVGAIVVVAGVIGVSLV